jgi:hypothetical protein
MNKAVLYASLAALSALVMACTSLSVAPNDHDPSDVGPGEVTSTTEQALTQTCIIGCPFGMHPVQYFCSSCGGQTCIVSYDSTVCDPDVGFSFTKCNVGGCPSGYHQTATSCSQNCVGSSGTICGFGSTNQTTCQINPPIISAGGIGNGGFPANGQGQFEFHPNTVLSIFGQNFVPFGSNVFVSQNGQTWRMPDANGAWWWNQNSSQINSSLPPGIVGNQNATVWVSTGSGTSAAQTIFIRP